MIDLNWSIWSFGFDFHLGINC